MRSSFRAFFALLFASSLGACTAESHELDASPDTGGTDTGAVGDAGRSCTRDDDCDDGVFCNGTESCAGGRCTTVVLPCDDGIACTTDFCNESARACSSQAVDGDGDGFGDADCVDGAGIPLGTDCADDDPDTFPGHAERCDDHDEDCDPTTLGGADMDLDGTQPSYCCNPGPTEGAPPVCGLDCDDTNPSISRLATEICDDVDNDCDGDVDEDVMRMSWPDLDFDGYGDDSATPEIVCDVPSSRASEGGDCNDADEDVHPREPERCNGVDEDCDGTIDEGAAAHCMAGRPGSTMECVAGACIVTGCTDQRFDCNDSAADGCEVATCDSSTNCGGCGYACVYSPFCGAGVCSLTGYPSQTITGTVRNAVTGGAIGGATIESVGTCPVWTTTTLSNGTYTLTYTSGPAPRWIRIRHPNYATHVQPVEAVSRIFGAAVVDAWRADPDAAATPSDTRAILVSDSVNGGFDSIHLGAPNGVMARDLVPFGSGERSVYMSVMPGHVRIGGSRSLPGGCYETCTPEFVLWLEPGTVTHIAGTTGCVGAC